MTALLERPQGHVLRVGLIQRYDLVCEDPFHWSREGEDGWSMYQGHTELRPDADVDRALAGYLCQCCARYPQPAKVRPWQVDALLAPHDRLMGPILAEALRRKPEHDDGMYLAFGLSRSGKLYVIEERDHG